MFNNTATAAENSIASALTSPVRQILLDYQLRRKDEE